MNTRITFKRVMPGLYVDSTEQFVISLEEPNWYSIRRFIKWGQTLNGHWFPDYASMWVNDFRTVAEAKDCIIQLLNITTDYGDQFMAPCDIARRD